MVLGVMYMPVFSLCAYSFEMYVRVKHLLKGRRALGFPDAALPKGNRNMRGILRICTVLKAKVQRRLYLPKALLSLV